MKMGASRGCGIGNEGLVGLRGLSQAFYVEDQYPEDSHFQLEELETHVLGKFGECWQTLWTGMEGVVWIRSLSNKLMIRRLFYRFARKYCRRYANTPKL